jgi:hypothetical protein
MLEKGTAVFEVQILLLLFKYLTNEEKNFHKITCVMHHVE